ncbi:hypothetical protein Trco_001916 [Trichoderma cornu-damae]|uniref:Uncharacterized protein n=1 Tax=Trichoderma cornu-damae TaxID=654480 RepID=A0A9P8QLM5_9HYPO|nr:hypothetical protein Trco_001916 [Trichoderma cornu-damae]
MPETSEPQSCPEKPIVQRNGFRICDGIFSVGSVSRVSGSRLHELFNPSTLGLKRDQKRAAEEARQLFGKPFYAAQLTHYGIPFQASAAGSELFFLLKDAAREGRCNQVPESVRELEAAMRRDYEPLHRKWESDMAAWRAAKERRDDEAFEKCKTPVEKANFDLQRFMDFYFLTDGKPDQAKTLEPLALHGFAKAWKLESMAWSTPGLHACNGGMSDDRTLCIGWDRGEVFKLARSITERAYTADKALRKAKWEQQLEAHRRYTARKQSRETAGGADGCPKPFSLDSCQGSYIIQCDTITEGWTSDMTGDTLMMDISRGNGGGLSAHFHFGIVRGTMVFSLSDNIVKALADGDSDASSRSEDADGYEEGNGGDDRQDDKGDGESGDKDDVDQQQSAIGGKKRKSGEASLEQGTEPADASAKRRKTGNLPPPSPTRRLYFQLDGYDANEGDAFPEPDPGHIDFLSDDCAAFAGLAYRLTFVADNVEFRGYKLKTASPFSPIRRDRYGVGC